MPSIPQFFVVALFLGDIQLSVATSPDQNPDPKGLDTTHTFPIKSADLVTSQAPDPDPENPPVRSMALRKLLKSPSPPEPEFDNADIYIHKSKAPPKIFTPEPPKFIIPLPIVPPNPLPTMMSVPPPDAKHDKPFVASLTPVKYVMMLNPGDGFIPKPPPEPFM